MFGSTFYHELDSDKNIQDYSAVFADIFGPSNQGNTILGLLKMAASVFSNQRPLITHLGEESADRQADPFPRVGNVPRVPGDGPWGGPRGSHRARHRHRCGGHKLFRGKEYAEHVQQKLGN